MRTLIIEDEIIAVRNLERLICDYDAAIEIEAPIHTVENAVSRLSSGDQPDLLFMDVQLADGLCFEIFNRIETEVPVIFTTAYDEYAIRAFEAHAVDYLLKPVSPDDFKRSMSKFMKLYSKQRVGMSADQVNTLISSYHQRMNKGKKRFLVRSGIRYKSILMDEIAYFYKDDLTYLVCWDQSRYVIDEPLSELEPLLPGDLFFRLNRQCICHIKAIKKMVLGTRSRLKVRLEPDLVGEVIVSHATAGKFKRWLNE